MPEWPQSGPIRDKRSPDSGGDSVAVAWCERAVLTKQRAGVGALGRRGGLRRKLSCTTLGKHAQRSDGSVPSALLLRGREVCPCATAAWRNFFGNISPACIPRASLSRIDSDVAHCGDFLCILIFGRSRSTSYPPKPQAMLIANPVPLHHISQTTYSDGNFLAHVAGACYGYVKRCVNKTMTPSGLNGLQMATDQ